MTIDEAQRKVRKVIGHRVAGYCYVASEAVYHLAGGKKAGLVPMVIRIDGRPPVGQHWWLEHRPTGKIIDVTAGQFRPPLTRAERSLGRGCGFLTRRPSIAAREIIRAVRNLSRTTHV